MKEINLSEELTQLNEYLFARKINGIIEIFEAYLEDKVSVCEHVHIQAQGYRVQQR